MNTPLASNLSFHVGSFPHTSTYTHTLTDFKNLPPRAVLQLLKVSQKVEGCYSGELAGQSLTNCVSLYNFLELKDVAATRCGQQ